MDQIKTGELIAKKRKDKGLTQKELGEKLFVSDRAVSKWEKGKSFPDSSIILELCEILGISVYSLLKGEEDMNENHTTDNKEIILELLKEKEKKDKLLLDIEIVVGTFSTIILLILIFVASYCQIETYLKIILIVTGLLLFIIGVGFAIRIEEKTGYYECKSCKHHFEPSYSAVLFAPHIFRSRLLRCPKCKKITLANKRIKK